MSAKKRGLGRGLEALLGGGDRPDSRLGRNLSPGVASVGIDMPASQGVVAQDHGETEKLSFIPVDKLQRGKYQPRRELQQEALEELAQSIRSHGVMQPIVVRSVAENRYEIIAGERRWRAAQLAELDTVPCIIREVPDEAAIALAIIENIQREDLNPIEEAVALKRLQDEFELTQQEVADVVGKSRTTITNLLRLMSLSTDVRRMLEQGELEMGHARCLLTLKAEQQLALARRIVAESLSVRQTEAMVRALQDPKASKQKPTTNTKSKETRQLEERLAEHIGVPVAIDHSSSGKGKLMFSYSSLDELDGILHHLGYKVE